MPRCRKTTGSLQAGKNLNFCSQQRCGGRGHDNSRPVAQTLVVQKTSDRVGAFSKAQSEAQTSVAQEREVAFNRGLTDTISLNITHPHLKGYAFSDEGCAPNRLFCGCCRLHRPHPGRFFGKNGLGASARPFRVPAPVELHLGLAHVPVSPWGLNNGVSASERRRACRRGGDRLLFRHY